MRKVLTMLVICTALGLFLTSQVFSHTPLCSCYDNGDGTVTCEGGFSDGSSAAGVSMKVVDENSEVISVKDENGEIIRDEKGNPIIDEDVTDVVEAWRKFKQKYLKDL